MVRGALAWGLGGVRGLLILDICRSLKRCGSFAFRIRTFRVLDQVLVDVRYKSALGLFGFARGEAAVFGIAMLLVSWLGRIQTRTGHFPFYSHR
jgi:hypothetical protein